MSLFASARERRLWSWAAATLVAIYSTLGSAEALADELRDRNLLRVAFVVAVAAILAPLAARWVRRGPDRNEIWVLMAVALAYFMVWSRAVSWEERTHLLEYGIVAGLIHAALIEREAHGRGVPMPALLTIVVTAVLGLVDEFVQALLPSRVFDIRDVGFNALAGFLVVAARLAMAPQRQPGWRVWFLWLMATSVGWGNGVYWGWFTDEEPKLLERVPVDLRAGYLGLVVGALVLGILQWLVLRRHIPRASRWLLSVISAAGVVGVLILVGSAVDRDASWYLGVSAFGLVAGGFQWLVLRTELSGAGWWVAASTIGWAAGMPFGDINGPPGLGAAYGLVTATMLVVLLRRSTADERGRSGPELSRAP